MGAAIPKLAEVYLGLLVATQQQYWPAAPEPWVMAAQVEKETCITLTHSKCWSPRAELKTSRENGIGFGQATRAYNSDGSIRFDKISELRAAHPAALRGWAWETRYDPELQMRGLVLADWMGFKRFKGLVNTDMDAWRFTLAGYNGGDGAVLQDRLACRTAPPCNPAVWYGNVELHSKKSRKPWKGYGQSAYEINRGYVRRVETRAPDYIPLWKKHDDTRAR